LKKYVVIVAAGAGKRFDQNIPKQFELLLGKPMLMYAIETFYQAEPGIQIIVVIRDVFQNHWKSICKSYDFQIPHQIALGGPERFHSVRNGLSLIPDDGLIAIHDGARPLVSRQLIRNAFCMAERFGAVAPAIEVNDSVRMVSGSHHKPVDRRNLHLVQTPQVFNASILKNAYRQQYDPVFTDDVTVVEAMGEKVLLIEGSSGNIKITKPPDLIIAGALLKSGGYDK
jgi:2-C-methyl-D-erythritol 4-phosphate cytidylyltransferase